MKYKLCQPLLCHVQLRHLDVVIVDDHHGVALNTIDFDFKHKRLCILNHHNFITFTFQRIVGRSQFSALSDHSDLRKHLVCHTGEKPLRL